jgi:uncharacterized protein YdeI (YjbR/CyaY-like superfamily)
MSARSSRVRARRVNRRDGYARIRPMDEPRIAPESRAAWAAWLDEQHEQAAAVWVQIAKKGSGVASVTQVEAVETALAYGWIDGRAAPLDERYWLQRFTPRRARSKWSKINRARAQRLIERGEMRPAGLRAIERAKADGRWDAA